MDLEAYFMGETPDAGNGDLFSDPVVTMDNEETSGAVNSILQSSLSLDSFLNDDSSDSNGINFVSGFVSEPLPVEEDTVNGNVATTTSTLSAVLTNDISLESYLKGSIVPDTDSSFTDATGAVDILQEAVKGNLLDGEGDDDISDSDDDDDDDDTNEIDKMEEEEGAESSDDEYNESDSDEHDEEEDMEDEEEDEDEEVELEKDDSEDADKEELNKMDASEPGKESVSVTDDADGEVKTEDKPEDGTTEEPSVAKKRKGATKAKKRKRKKKGEKGKKPKAKKKRRDSHARKNIRDIMKEGQLEASTLEAQNEELERKRRLMELKKSLQQKSQGFSMPSIEKPKEKDSQLKSLLQEAEEEAEKNKDLIMLDSSDDSKNKLKADADKDVIELSSDEDEVVMVTHQDDEEDEIEDEDPNNAGSHVNDAFNRRDNYGRVIVNIGHPSEDPDIYLAPQVARAIKPHQIGGVRFLYDNLVESMGRFKTSNGFGCILAHSMGLGKTIQMIGFVDIFLRYTGSKSVLCIVPLNTLQNWLAEFNRWLPAGEAVAEGSSDVLPRSFKVFLLNDSYKNTASRAKVIEEWRKDGGVLVMGYEMYRLLSSRKVHLLKPKRSKRSTEPEVIDLDEEDQNKALLTVLYSALVNPGPDLIVCDEGHRIKNSATGIAQSLKNIKTRRRVCLTGYPLQNNMIEYWCMVDFVRPNFLGSKTEFCNMFERPIMNGQCKDSTPQDVRVMRYRAHVLHSLLEGFVQRRGHTVLQAALPPKQEYVILVKMSPIQQALYKQFIDDINCAGFGAWPTTNPIKAFSVCCKIWNHPDVLQKILTQKRLSAAEDDLDLDTESRSSTDNGVIKRRMKKSASQSSISSQSSQSIQDDGFFQFPEKRSDANIITYDWVDDLMKDYKAGDLEMGGKMVLLFSLIEESLTVGDKILVFSQSLFTLSLLEDFLSQRNVPRPDMNERWCRNKTYFRLDGSTVATERERMINLFNQPDNNRVWLFLLSTRAGSLGINLVGANRVVVLDASWNPCHDCQSICRVYRFGQEKPSFIYRMVTENTMEKKIYDRQINKQGMADRVVDELQPQNIFMKGQVDNLLHYEEKDFPEVDLTKHSVRYEDPVLARVLSVHSHWLTKAPFTHESLLIDRKELRLTKREKRLAKQSYVMEKRMNVSYTRPTYGTYYAKDGPPAGPTPWGDGMGPGRPVASVKPMMSTPVPMYPKHGMMGNFPMNQLVRPGVSIHQVITTTDIMLPGTNTRTVAGQLNRIPAGQQVLVIKTPRGVYIRTNDGRIFAVRVKPTTPSPRDPSLQSIPLSTLTSTANTVTLAKASSFPSFPTGSSSQVSTAVPPRPQEAQNCLQADEVSMPTTGQSSADFLASIYSHTQAVNRLLQPGDQEQFTPPRLPPSYMPRPQPPRMFDWRSEQSVRGKMMNQVRANKGRGGRISPQIRPRIPSDMSPRLTGLPRNQNPYRSVIGPRMATQILKKPKGNPNAPYAPIAPRALPPNLPVSSLNYMPKPRMVRPSSVQGQLSDQFSPRFRPEMSPQLISRSQSLNSVNSLGQSGVPHNTLESASEGKSEMAPPRVPVSSKSDLLSPRDTSSMQPTVISTTGKAPPMRPSFPGSPPVRVIRPRRPADKKTNNTPVASVSAISQRPFNPQNIVRPARAKTLLRSPSEPVLHGRMYSPVNIRTPSHTGLRPASSKGFYGPPSQVNPSIPRTTVSPLISHQSSVPSIRQTVSQKLTGKRPTPSQSMMRPMQEIRNSPLNINPHLGSSSDEDSADDEIEQMENAALRRTGVLNENEFDVIQTLINRDRQESPNKFGLAENPESEFGLHVNVAGQLGNQEQYLGVENILGMDTTVKGVAEHGAGMGQVGRVNEHELVSSAYQFGHENRLNGPELSRNSASQEASGSLYSQARLGLPDFLLGSGGLMTGSGESASGTTFGSGVNSMDNPLFGGVNLFSGGGLEATQILSSGDSRVGVVEKLTGRENPVRSVEQRFGNSLSVQNTAGNYNLQGQDINQYGGTFNVPNQSVDSPDQSFSKDDSFQLLEGLIAQDHLLGHNSDKLTMDELMPGSNPQYSESHTAQSGPKQSS